MAEIFSKASKADIPLSGSRADPAHGSWWVDFCRSRFAGYRLRKKGKEVSQFGNIAPARFQDRPHFPIGGGRAGEGDIGVEMVDNVILHSHRTDVA